MGEGKGGLDEGRYIVSIYMYRERAKRVGDQGKERRLRVKTNSSKSTSKNFKTIQFANQIRTKQICKLTFWLIRINIKGFV